MMGDTFCLQIPITARIAFRQRRISIQRKSNNKSEYHGVRHPQYIIDPKLIRNPSFT